MSDDQIEMPELWGVDELALAAYLGVGKAFVYTLTSQRRIRFVRVGKTVRFRRADVLAWLESETVSEAKLAPVPARRGRPRNRDRGAA
jgi:excisionase family DNA binding protein